MNDYYLTLPMPEEHQRPEQIRMLLEEARRETMSCMPSMAQQQAAAAAAAQQQLLAQQQQQMAAAAQAQRVQVVAVQGQR